ncbi:hypothetical protein CJU90_3294 [Yarrowia sp. C11]|nr:hypothetical protein CKK34_4741 [Yarrowia sp. E02]KAG5369767.1 hypothetical protein CJU90_3294 [Yarrowia sp. C11]
MNKQTYFTYPDKIVVVFTDPRVPQIKLPPPADLGLPASVAKSSLSVAAGDQHIVATFSGPEEIVYVMPRDFPYFYFGHGFKYTADMGCDVTNYMMASAYALQVSNEEDVTKGTFLLADMNGKRFVSLFDADSSTTPVAVYRGLLWVYVHSSGSKKCLVPLRIDLKDSVEQSDGIVALSSVSWNKSRVIGGLRGYPVECPSKSRNTHRYLTLSRGSKQMEIVDLVTGTSVFVGGSGEVFPGFKEGRFEAWQYSQKCIDRLKRGLKRAQRYIPNQVYYGLTNVMSTEDVQWGYNRLGEWVALTEEEIAAEAAIEEKHRFLEPQPREDEFDDEEEEEEETEEEEIWQTDRWGRFRRFSREEIEELEREYGEEDEEEDEW